MLHRATDLANGIHQALQDHARTFAELGCRYQQRRTETLLDSERHRPTPPVCGHEPEGVTPLGK